MASDTFARRSGILAVAAIMAVTAGAASAQDARRVRGTITGMEGDTLSVKTREGETVDIALAEGWKVNGVANASMSDIDEGDFVGIASVPNADGSDGALEVLIFPAERVGSAGASFPWDLQPGSTMTNATVADKVEGVNGHSVSVTYEGGQKDISIPEGTPIVTFAEATPADLIEGATVFIPAEMANGALSATTVVVGKNGVVPPM